MDKDSVISVEEVHRWRDDDVTLEVFSRMIGKIRELDQEVHQHLLLGGEDELMKAAFLNARLQQLKEVLNIHEDILEELRGE